jgi:uncharacterized protein YqeY
MPRSDPAERVCAALRLELTTAMKQRDPDAVVALRTAIAAIENAQAIEVRDTGLGATMAHMSRAGHEAAQTELPRRELSDAQVDAIIRAQINERQQDSKRYDALGQAEAATHLRAEAAALARAWESIDWR